MRKGFTLIELSIVLVIIGLLIGGILVAQSMIQTSRVLEFVKKVQQYDIAIANFKTNYKQFPGDSNLFTPAGNNDNDFTDVTANTPSCGIASCYEYYSLWKHLSDAGMIENNIPYTNNRVGGAQPGINEPDLGKYYGLITYGYNSLENDPIFPVGKLFIFGFFSAADSHPTSYLFAADAKLDDGKSDSGYMRIAYLDPGLGLITCTSAHDYCFASLAILFSTGTSEPAF